MKLPYHPESRETATGSEAQPAPVPEESPRTVIRGESPPPDEPNATAWLPFAALTDWLNVSFPFSPTESGLGEFVDRLGAATDDALGGMADRGRGLHGYLRSFVFDRGGAMFAVGGQRNTGFLSLPGEACAEIRDWQALTRLLRDELGGRITRWDGAVDAFEGNHSVDLAVQLYLSGGFNAGGTPPSCRQIGNWLAPDGRGRTFAVGRRESGKMLRVYEKGKQLGLAESTWVRWEIELHNVDRVIPWDVLAAPGVYVAGAYPCMAWVHDQACRIRTVKAQDAISYERLTHVGSLAYGALINVMLAREGNAERVVEKLRRDGVPRRLAFSDDFLNRHGDELGR